MKESLQIILEQYCSVLDTLRNEFKWEHDQMYPVCANLFVHEGKDADPDKIRDCKNLVKQSVGVFSSFRGNLTLPLACMLSVDPDPEKKWGKALDSYALLKEHFMGSQYLALAAVAMGEAGSTDDLARIAERGRTLYERMKKEHPFLTGSEDSVFAVLLAQSEKSNDDLIRDMEACYQILDTKFPKGNAMQSASHILALAEGEPAQKAERVISLFEKIREEGGKYGKDYELPILSAASITGGDEDELVRDILDAAERLGEHTKYNGLLGYDKKTRYMHAAMLVTADRAKEAGKSDLTGQITVSQSALSLVIAEQILMCSVIASTAASSAASTAH